MSYFNKRTMQTIPIARHCGDLSFPSNLGNDAIDNESVPLVGPWKEYDQEGNVTGSNTTINSKAQQQFGGITNKFKGTIAGKMGAKLGNLNKVGGNKDTIRRRKRIIYVKLDEN